MGTDDWEGFTRPGPDGRYKLCDWGRGKWPTEQAKPCRKRAHTRVSVNRSRPPVGELELCDDHFEQTKASVPKAKFEVLEIRLH